jgi:hypothetical protein
MTCPFAPFAGVMAKYGYELEASGLPRGGKVFRHKSGNAEVRLMPLNANRPTGPRTSCGCAYHCGMAHYLASNGEMIGSGVLRRFGAPTHAALAALEAWGQP